MEVSFKIGEKSDQTGSRIISKSITFENQFKRFFVTFDGYFELLGKLLFHIYGIVYMLIKLKLLFPYFL